MSQDVITKVLYWSLNEIFWQYHYKHVTIRNDASRVVHCAQWQSERKKWKEPKGPGFDPHPPADLQNNYIALRTFLEFNHIVFYHGMLTKVEGSGHFTSLY